MNEAPDRTALYRLYDAGDRLLYVGISRDPTVRFIEHAHWKSWWHHVARTEIAWLDRREDAASSEDAAIREERPLYNGTLHLGPKWRRRKLRYDATAEIGCLTDALREALTDGRYKPGSHLWAMRVGIEFGLSRSIANSAMRALEAEGLLVGRGAGFSVPSSR